MIASGNRAQFDAWNGDSGQRWVGGADERDAVLLPVADALFAAAAPRPGAHVLDVGCGCGATTLRAAHTVGEGGAAIGIDLSQPMLDLASQRARRARARNLSFIHGDAQTHGFTHGTLDLVISRFGTMFFSDANAAFANIGRGLRPGGRLCIAAWQPLLANQWLTVPGTALARHADLPESDARGPGMFAQSDPDAVSAILAAAGYVDVSIDDCRVTFTLGRTLDAAVAHLADGGPGRAMLESIPTGPDRDAAIADVREVLAAHHDGSGVHLDGAIWIIRARRP